MVNNMKNKKEIKRRRNRNLRHKSTFYCNSIRDNYGYYVYSPVPVSGPHAKISIVIPPAIEASTALKESLDVHSWEHLCTAADEGSKESAANVPHTSPTQASEQQCQSMPDTKRRVWIGLAAALAVASGIVINLKYNHAHVR